MARDVITILHVSDMQFGKYHRFGEKFPGAPPNDYETLTQRLILDLKDLMGREKEKPQAPIARPDLIICTGDLAEWGMKKEFDQAFDFLGRLAEHLELTRDRVVVIPGNHDINRKQCQSYFLECEGNEQQPVFPWFPKWKQFKDAFDNFYAGFPSITFAPAQPWTLFEIGDLAVVVAGMNSTMDEGHDEAVNSLIDQGHHGLCTEKQLRWFKERLDESRYRFWLRIGAVHHNIERGCRADNENLRDADQLGVLLGSSLEMILHGHTHHAKSGQLHRVPVYSTGSASLKTHGANVVPADVPNQYQVITLKRDSLTRYGRRYNSADAPPKWIGDTSLSRNGNDWIVTDNANLSSAHEALPECDEEFHRLDLQEVLRRYPGNSDTWRREHQAAADLFLDRVAELTRLRFEDVQIQKLHWRKNDLRCLNISYRTESGILVSRPLATALKCPTRDELDALKNEIVVQYRAAEPRLFADCICGDAAELTDELRSSAQECGIRFQRIGEYRGLIDLTSFVEGQTQRIERLQAAAGYRSDWYVNQRLSIETGGKRSSTDDALTTIAEWMKQPEPTFVLLLGEPGTGKTFLMLELARHLAKQPCLRPILVELRGMEKSKSVAALLGSLFSEHLQPSDPVKLNHMISEGAVTLLFDGFDELALRVGYSRAVDHLNEIIDAAQGDSPHIIVTSRTSHFESDRQVRNKLAEALQKGVRGLKYCHVPPFEHGQIETYLQKRFHQEASDWLQLLRDVQDLIGLSRIPRMLAFITDVARETLEAARHPETGSVSAGDVYRLVIVDQWLPYEYQRMNQPGSAELFTKDQMLDAVRHLAQALWRSTDRFISLSELSEHAHRILEKCVPEKLSQEGFATHQLGSGTLLMRDADGRFTFIHQSIMEWLVAEQAAADIRDAGSTDILDQSEVSSLMADFLIDLTGRNVVLDWAMGVQRATSAVTDREHGKANALLVVRRLKVRYGVTVDEDDDDTRDLIAFDAQQVARNFVNVDMSGADLSGELLDQANMEGVNLFEASLENASLTEAKLLRADLRNASLRRADLQSADLRDADLSNSDCSFADLRGANLTNANFSRATLIGADLRGATLTGSQWQFARLAGATLDDPTPAGLERFGAGLPDVPPVALLQPGSSPVFAVGWSECRDLLATGHENGLVVLWDVATGTELRTFNKHTRSIRGVSLSVDGTRLATASDDETAILWDAATGRDLWTFMGHTGSVASVSLSADGTRLATGSYDKTAKLWDTATGRELETFTGHTGSILGVCLSADGTRLATGSHDSTARLWDTATGRVVREFTGHSRSVRSVSLNADSTRLATGSADNTAKLWDTATGNELGAFTGHSSSVWSVSLNADSTRLATGSADNTAKLWDTATGRALREFKGHFDSVWSVSLTADGTRLATGSGDKTARLWDTAAGNELRAFTGHSNWVGGVSLCANGTRLAVGSHDNTAKLWDTVTGRKLRAFTGHSNWVASVNLSADGTRLATGSFDNTARLWDATAGTELCAFTGHTDLVLSVSLSADGTRLATASYDSPAKLWDVETGKELPWFMGLSKAVRSVSLSADGTRLATASLDGATKLWDAETGIELCTFTGHSGAVVRVSLSADGTRLATGSDDNTARLWDTTTGKDLRAFSGHSGSVWSVILSADGTRLATGSDDKTAKLWDAATGRPLRTFTGHLGRVSSVLLWQGRADRALLLISASDDGTVRIWDTNSGDCLRILLVQEDGWAAVRPDGRYRVAGDVSRSLWYVSGLARYELSELDEVFPDLKLADDEPLIPPEYFGQ